VSGLVCEFHPGLGYVVIEVVVSTHAFSFYVYFLSLFSTFVTSMFLLLALIHIHKCSKKAFCLCAHENRLTFLHGNKLTRKAETRK